MNELVNSEKVLKARVIEKCNENFIKIKGDYRKFSEVSSYVKSPSVVDLVKNSENLDRRDFISHLSRSLASLDKPEEELPNINGGREERLESLEILELIRNRNHKIVESTIYTCTIDKDCGGNTDFKNYEDGYYKLERHLSQDSTNELFDLRENYTSVVDNYWKSVKTNPKEELSILKDIQSEVSKVSTQDSEDDITVKSLFLSKLTGAGLKCASSRDYFKDYYNFNNKKRQSLNFDIEKQLRQVYISPKESESKEFGWLAKGATNDLILEKNGSGVAEYMVVFEGKDRMEVYRCETLHPQVTSQKHVEKGTMSKFLGDEVVRQNLRDKLMLKLKRHQNAKGLNAKDVKSSNIINKFITSATLGCLWKDWNYYGGIIVPEVSIQEILREPQAFLDSMDDDLAASTRAFLEKLDSSVNNMDTFENICATVRELVLSYRSLIMGKFNEDYQAIKNKSFLDLKTRPQQSDLTLASPSRLESSQLEEDTPSQDADLHEQRLQMLPQFNRNAKSPEELTSLSQLAAVFTTDFDPDPFVSLMNLAKVKSVSKTVLNASKAMKAKGKNECLDDTKLVLSSLKILDVLVFLLQKLSKSFNSPKELQSFISASKYKVDAGFVNVLFHLFYEKSHDTHSIKVLGSKRLMCYTIWLCIYLSPKFTFDFSPLINIDLKNISNAMLFSSCVDLTSIAVAGRTNKNLYKLKTPLSSGSKKINIGSLILHKNKRFRAR
ncbi:conserved hypothetical protein [Theileria orientalis strain Shintoku]|uniref:Uncharacterized protein n=1 Tax=Theileria orientalis strain Shintoku TaxID=869250 RepID=J4CCH9_THEOR|nr:conserved hypothetical protein [Theileria orientalis strain Shintoku]PVC50037.1 hypothetical protein MACL_00002565 [Theileria orientalis]BAM39422.1 conserved hypothetical protein [Theileria orientalis strain Shintoku]|eukprot:XP_009689723.1 conserved hypothetical protein [Theileria orientalis strain Shintoku]